jgi:hypothetical protein
LSALRILQEKTGNRDKAQEEKTETLIIGDEGKR